MSSSVPTLYEQILSELYQKRDQIETAITGMKAIAGLFAGVEMFGGACAVDGAAKVVSSTATAKTSVPVVVRRGRKPKAVATNATAKLNTGGPTCNKHPHNTEFDKKGTCRVCQREYAKANWRKKHPKKNGVAPGPERSSIPGPKPEPYVLAIDDLDDVEIEEPDPEQIEDDELTGDELPGMAAREVAAIPERHLTHEFVYSKPTRCPKCGMEGARLRRMKHADMAKDCWIHPGRNCAVKIAHYQIKDDLRYQPEAA